MSIFGGQVEIGKLLVREKEVDNLSKLLLDIRDGKTTDVNELKEFLRKFSSTKEESELMEKEWKWLKEDHADMVELARVNGLRLASSLSKAESLIGNVTYVFGSDDWTDRFYKQKDLNAELWKQLKQENVSFGNVEATFEKRYGFINKGLKANQLVLTINNDNNYNNYSYSNNNISANNRNNIQPRSALSTLVEFQEMDKVRKTKKTIEEVQVESANLLRELLLKKNSNHKFNQYKDYPEQGLSALSDYAYYPSLDNARKAFNIIKDYSIKWVTELNNNYNKSVRGSSNIDLEYYKTLILDEELFHNYGISWDVIYLTIEEVADIFSKEKYYEQYSIENDPLEKWNENKDIFKTGYDIDYYTRCLNYAIDMCECICKCRKEGNENVTSSLNGFKMIINHLNNK